MVSSRKIPSTMATQHPDNAGAAWWLGRSYIDTKSEVEEVFVSFSKLGCREFMWDWEGKYVDEAVVERLLEAHLDYFRKNELGRKAFLTFRLPNIWQEKGYRIARALVGIISANDIALDLGLHEPAVFESILPMTDDARKLIFIQKNYMEMAATFKRRGHATNHALRIIPLLEDQDTMLNAGKLVEDYCALHKKEFGREVDYLRPFIARSDPALNYGLVPAVLGAKTAIHNIYSAGERLNVDVYPIIGVGSLPFRGHLSPANLKNYLKEYAGIRTTTVQSALRYDYPMTEAKKTVKALNEGQKAKPNMMDDGEMEKAGHLIKAFTNEYRKTIEKLSGYICRFAEQIPARRERRMHIGLFGYSRMVAGHRLPRAIPFVAALYSLGVPPELIGTGRGLRAAERLHLTDALFDNYLNLKGDLEAAGHYYNQANLKWLARANPAWREVERDVALIEDSLGIELGPAEIRHHVHRNMTSNIKMIYESGEDARGEIVHAAELRCSLG